MKAPNDKMKQAEFGLLRGYLATKGFSQSWINANTSITKTRQEIVDDLRAALKNP